jgi:zinc finger SWIM domain-containing protein 3
VEHGTESDVNYIPQLEMEFESEIAAYDFYNEYSKKTGFGIRREYGNKSKKDGILTSRRFVCSKEGDRGVDKRDYLTKEPRAETRTGCTARMCISLDRKIGKYKVVDFIPWHNHTLQPQEFVHMIRSHRRIYESQAIQIVLADESGLKPKDFHEYVSRQVGGKEMIGYTSQHGLQIILALQVYKELGVQVNMELQIILALQVYMGLQINMALQVCI